MTDETKPQAGEDINHVKSQMQNWMAKATDLEKRLEGFKGIDPTRYRALEEEVVNLKKDAAKTPEELEGVIRADFDKRYGEKFSQYETENKTLKERINGLEVVNPTMLKAADVFNSKELPLIQRLVKEDLALDKDGQIYVRGDDGKPRASKVDPRKNMDITEYLEGLAEQYPGCAKPRGKGGTKDAGTTAPANGAGNTQITLEKYLSMTQQERIAAIPDVRERGKLADQALRMMK